MGHFPRGRHRIRLRGLPDRQADAAESAAQMVNALKALWTLYRIERGDRAAIVAAVQFMEGQHLANGIGEVLRLYPCRKAGR